MRSLAPLILCVDDEIVGLEARKLILEHAGYKVLTAGNGDTGIQVLHQQPVCAVILDYSMPDMTGDEVAGRMRRVKPEIPIVLHSATASLPQQVLEVVDAFVPKGDGAPALLQWLDHVLGTHAEAGPGAVRMSG